MSSPHNEHLKSHKIDFPQEFLEMIREKSIEDDENISSLIRRVMAAYVGWSGPVRNVKDYNPENTRNK